MGRKAAIPSPTSLKQSPEFDQPQFVRLHAKSGKFAAQSHHDQSHDEGEAFDSMLVRSRPVFTQRRQLVRDLTHSLQNSFPASRSREMDHNDREMVNEGPIPPPKRSKPSSTSFLDSAYTTTRIERDSKRTRPTRNQSNKIVASNRWSETAGEPSSKAVAKSTTIRQSNSKPSRDPHSPLTTTTTRPSLFDAPSNEEANPTIFRRPPIPNVKSFLDSLPVPLSPLYPTFARLGCTSSKDMLALASPTAIGVRCRDAFLELLDDEFIKVAGTGLSSWHRIVLLEGLKAEWEVHGTD